MKYSIFISIVLLAGCTVEQRAGRQIARAKKLILKAEANGATWARDTVWATRNIPIPGIQVDTTIDLHSFDLSFENVGDVPAHNTIDLENPGAERVDSLHILKGTLDVKVRVGKKPGKRPTLAVSARQIPDTVIVRVPVEVENKLSCPPCVQRIRWWAAMIAGLGLLIVGIIVGWLVRR